MPPSTSSSHGPENRAAIGQPYILTATRCIPIFSDRRSDRGDSIGASVFVDPITRDIDKNVWGVEDGEADVDFLAREFESVFKEAITRDIDKNVGDVKDCEIHVDFLARELESVFEEKLFGISIRM